MGNPIKAIKEAKKRIDNAKKCPTAQKLQAELFAHMEKCPTCNGEHK